VIKYNIYLLAYKEVLLKDDDSLLHLIRAV